MLRTMIGVATVLLLLGAQPAHANQTNDQANVDDIEHTITIGGPALVRLSLPATAARDPLATARVYLAKADTPKADATPDDAKKETAGKALGPIDVLIDKFRQLKKAFDVYKAEKAKAKEKGESTTGPLLTFLLALGATLVTAGQVAVAWLNKRKKA